MSAYAKESENDVVWYWSKDYKKRVESLKIKADEASKTAWKEWERTKRPISEKPMFIVGRCTALEWKQKWMHRLLVTMSMAIPGKLNTARAKR